MLGPGFFDELDFDSCGDLFDHIDDLLNFPMEDLEGDIVGGDCDNLKGVWPAQSDAFDGSNTVFSTNNCTKSASQLPTELPVPYEDIAELGWPSDVVDHSFSIETITTLDKEKSSDNNNMEKNGNGESHGFETSSPVSVLERNSSCDGGKNMPLSPETVFPGRSRSKRQRPAFFNPRSVISLNISPTSSLTEHSPPFSTSFENSAESQPAMKIPKYVPTEHKNKKKRKLSPLPGAMDLSASPQPMAVRKCMHCQITKTPQWRMGPMGPKTLCNACGVRHKSGRLFPEYRPAASPTFVSSLHSNSHKKVLEMRNKVGQKMDANATMASPSPKFIPTSSLLHG